MIDKPPLKTDDTTIPEQIVQPEVKHLLKVFINKTPTGLNGNIV